MLSLVHSLRRVFAPEGASGMFMALLHSIENDGITWADDGERKRRGKGERKGWGGQEMVQTHRAVKCSGRRHGRSDQEAEVVPILFRELDQVLLQHLRCGLHELLQVDHPIVVLVGL